MAGRLPYRSGPVVRSGFEAALSLVTGIVISRAGEEALARARVCLHPDGRIRRGQRFGWEYLLLNPMDDKFSFNAVRLRPLPGPWAESSFVLVLAGNRLCADASHLGKVDQPRHGTRRFTW